MRLVIDRSVICLISNILGSKEDCTFWDNPYRFEILSMSVCLYANRSTMRRLTCNIRVWCEYASTREYALVSNVNYRVRQ